MGSNMNDDLTRQFEHVAAQADQEADDLAQMSLSMDSMEQTLLQIPPDHAVPELRNYRKAGLAQVEAGRRWRDSLATGNPDLIARLGEALMTAAFEADAAGLKLDEWMTSQGGAQ